MNDLPSISQYQVFKNRKRILKILLPFHNENSGNLFRVILGLSTSIAFARNSKLIEHILQGHHREYYKSPQQTEDLAKYKGHGILTSNGGTGVYIAEWFNLRFQKEICILASHRY